MSEWTIEGDETMRWDVLASAPAEQETPVQEDRHDCDGCRGDGVYHGRGYVENGVFKGFTGTCFRCQGKGFQTKSDLARCRVYDNKYRRFTD